MTETSTYVVQFFGVMGQWHQVFEYDQTDTGRATAIDRALDIAYGGSAARVIARTVVVTDNEIFKQSGAVR